MIVPFKTPSNDNTTQEKITKFCLSYAGVNSMCFIENEDNTARVFAAPIYTTEAISFTLKYGNRKFAKDLSGGVTKFLLGESGESMILHMTMDESNIERDVSFIHTPEDPEDRVVVFIAGPKPFNLDGLVIAVDAVHCCKGCTLICPFKIIEEDE